MSNCNHLDIIEKLQTQLSEANELAKEAIGHSCLHSLTQKDCDYCQVRQELAEAKAEIEELRAAYFEASLIAKKWISASGSIPRKS